MPRATHDLASIELRSGVDEDGYEPFIHVAIYARGEDHALALGQLTPAEARAHALAFMEAAEAADTDALIMGGLVAKLVANEDLDTERSEVLAGHLVTLLRETRAEAEGNE